MSAAIPSIALETCSLAPLQPADAPGLFQVYQGEDVLKYFPGQTPPPLERVERFIASQQKHWEQHGFGNWGVYSVGENQVIGWAGLQFLPELNETEVGFLLDRAWWGKGIATQAARAALKFGFETCGLPHIIALVEPENLASRRVIEKCGLEYVETIRLWDTELRRYRLERPAGE